MTLRREASTASCRELGVSPSRDQNCENNPMQSRDRASHDSKTQDLVAGLPASLVADANAITERPARARSDLHQRGLVGEFTVEIRRAGEAMPRLDAKERYAAGFRPHAEFAKSFPGHFDRGTAIRGEAHRRTRQVVHDDR